MAWGGPEEFDIVVGGQEKFEKFFSQIGIFRVLEDPDTLGWV
jgi:hypothetical protein